MGGNPDIFKMTIERKGKKVTLSGSEADVDAFWGLIRSHLSELDGACTNAQSTLAETPKEPLPSAQAVHTAPSICGAAPDKPAQKRRPNTARAQVSDSIGPTSDQQRSLYNFCTQHGQLTKTQLLLLIIYWAGQNGKPAVSCNFLTSAMSFLGENYDRNHVYYMLKSMRSRSGYLVSSDNKFSITAQGENAIIKLITA